QANRHDWPTLQGNRPVRHKIGERDLTEFRLPIARQAHLYQAADSHADLLGGVDVHRAVVGRQTTTRGTDVDAGWLQFRSGHQRDRIGVDGVVSADGVDGVAGRGLAFGVYRRGTNPHGDRLLDLHGRVIGTTAGRLEDSWFDGELRGGGLGGQLLG